MAAQQAPGAERRSTQEPEARDRLLRVMRTRGLVAAGGADRRRDGDPVSAEEDGDDGDDAPPPGLPVGTGAERPAHEPSRRRRPRNSAAVPRYPQPVADGRATTTRSIPAGTSPAIRR